MTIRSTRSRISVTRENGAAITVDVTSDDVDVVAYDARVGGSIVSLPALMEVETFDLWFERGTYTVSCIWRDTEIKSETVTFPGSAGVTIDVRLSDVNTLAEVNAAIGATPSGTSMALLDCRVLVSPTGDNPSTYVPLDPVHTWGGALLPVTPWHHGSNGHILGGVSMGVPAFTAPGLMIVTCFVSVTDLTGDNSLFLDFANIGEIPEGQYAGGTFSLDWDEVTPEIIGTDLVAATQYLTTTAGGFYAGVVHLRIGPD